MSTSADSAGSSPAGSPKRRAPPAGSERLKQIRLSVHEQLAQAQQKQAEKLQQLKKAYPQQLGPVRPPNPQYQGNDTDHETGHSGYRGSASEARDTAGSSSSSSSENRIASGSAAKAVRRQRSSHGMTDGKAKGKSRKPSGRFKKSQGAAPDAASASKRVSRFRRGTPEQEQGSRAGGFLPPIQTQNRPSTWPNAEASGDGRTVEWDDSAFSPGS